jgi:hypothetical protein
MFLTMNLYDTPAFLLTQSIDTPMVLVTSHSGMDTGSMILALYAAGRTVDV